MADRYRICLILPKNNPHALCFREVGMLILSALKSNGYPCDFALNQLDPEGINIILGYHLMTFEPGLKKFRYIPYQLEQLHSQEYPFTDNMKRILQHAYQVWDYSEKNQEFLKKQGIDARLLIPGYHPNLRLVPKSSTRDIDILFYGSVGERRKAILDQLAKKFKLQILFGVYGEGRDKFISRSRLVLNFHHYSQQIFEAVRVSYLLNNRCFVLSENSVNYPYKGVDLPMCAYEELVDECHRFLKNESLMEEIRNTNHQQFIDHYPMVKFIHEVLD